MFDQNALTQALYKISESLGKGFWYSSKASLSTWLTNGSMIFSKYLKNRHPIDGGRTYRGKRLFGDHKTWEGIGIGAFSGTVGGYSVNLLADHLNNIIDYSLPETNLAYIIFSTVSVQGMDLLESFYKRRKGTDPGELKTLKEKIINAFSWASLYPALYCAFHGVRDPIEVGLVYCISLTASGAFHYLTNKLSNSRNKRKSSEYLGNGSNV